MWPPGPTGADGTRRIAEQEAAWWISEVVAPALAAGEGPEEIANAEFTDRSTPLAEQAVLAMHRDIGSVELRGVEGTVHLIRAHLA